MALVNQSHIRRIKSLSKIDPAEALIRGEAYLKGPDEYQQSKYASPYHSIDEDMRYLANQAYESGYRAEGKMLQKKQQDANKN